MKKNFQGIQIDGQFGAFMHDNNNAGIQAIDDAHAVATGNPAFNAPSGTSTFGDRRDLSVLMGTNIAHGAGNITAYLTYHNQDPVAGNKLDYASCGLLPGFFTGGPPNGLSCSGSSNSNVFIVNGNNYSVVG